MARKKAVNGIVVESGILIPARKPSRYPFADMEVGDSFVVREGQSRIGAAASHWGKAHGRKFITRKVDGGVRCWRVE